jgi:hypothetical protein
MVHATGFIKKNILLCILNTCVVYGSIWLMLLDSSRKIIFLCILDMHNYTDELTRNAKTIYNLQMEYFLSIVYS